MIIKSKTHFVLSDYYQQTWRNRRSGELWRPNNLPASIVLLRTGDIVMTLNQEGKTLYNIMANR